MRIDPAQAGIKRGGFAGTGRAGDDEDAVGPLDDFGHVIMDVFGKTERLDFQVHRRAVQHAQHDRFAECVGSVETRKSIWRPSGCG